MRGYADVQQDTVDAIHAELVQHAVHIAEIRLYHRRRQPLQPLTGGRDGVRILVQGDKTAGFELFRDGRTVATATGCAVQVYSLRLNVQRFHGLFQQNRLVIPGSSMRHACGTSLYFKIRI